jgi:hypothetical protein
VHITGRSRLPIQGRGQTIIMVASIVALLVLAGASRAAAAGVWSSPTSISGTDTLAPGVVPSVAMDVAGDAYAVWTTASDSSGHCPCTVRAASSAAGTATFGAPVTVSTPASGTNAENARVAMDAAGDVIVVWNDPSGGGVLGTSAGPKVFASIKPTGGGFGAPVAVSTADAGGTSPAVGMDSRGDAVLAYATKTASGATHAMTAFAPPGGPFGEPTDIVDPNDDVTGWGATNLAVSPDGHAAVAFNAITGCEPSSTECASEVKAATAPPGGPFGTPTTVSPVDEAGEPFLNGPSSFSSVATDDSGDAAVGYVGSTTPEGSSFSTQPTAEVTFSDAGAPFIFTGSIGSPPMAWGPAVAFDGSREGVAIAASGTSSADATGLDAAVRLPGAGFGPTQSLSPAGINGQLAVSGDLGSDDETLGAWVTLTSSGDSAIEAAFRSPGTQFGATRLVIGTTGQAPPAQQLSAAIDGAGDGAIVWPTGDGHVDASLSSQPPPAPLPGPVLAFLPPLTVTKLVTVTKTSGHVSPRIRGFKARGRRVTFELGCTGGRCRGTVSAVTTVKGKLAVRRHGRRVTVVKPIVVTVAKRSFALPAGTTRRYTLSLNRTGQELLAEHGKLGIALQIKLGRSQWATGKVTVHSPPPHGKSHG